LESDPPASAYNGEPRRPVLEIYSNYAKKYPGAGLFDLCRRDRGNGIIDFIHYVDKAHPGKQYPAQQ